MDQLMVKRIAALREKMAQAQVQAVIIASSQNSRYLSGFISDGSIAGYLLITAQQLYLVTDYRYAEQAVGQCPLFEVICRDREKVSLGQQFKLLLPDQVKYLAYENEHTSVAALAALTEAFMGSGIALQGIAGWVEQLRMIKDDTEIAAIRQAAAIADAALAQWLTSVTVGMSEREAALALEYLMQRGGSEGLSFATILVSGERSALPHGMPSERRLQAGDLLTIDFGAVVAGYRSDMTRAFTLGEATIKQQAVYQTVKAAQQAAMAIIKAGIGGEQPYLAAKKVLDDSEFSQYQGEGLGHGVGLALHEWPFMGRGCSHILAENMVITVEPGIYIPGWGGVRLEDDILVTERGFELITHAPATLIEI